MCRGESQLTARKLKTYTTSAGFFDLAVAAPSMKAALEAWGSTNNLFHQGFAKVSDDPEVECLSLWPSSPGEVRYSANRRGAKPRQAGRLPKQPRSGALQCSMG